MTEWTRDSLFSSSAAILAASIVLALGRHAPACPCSSPSSGSGCCSARTGPGGIEFDDAELTREDGNVGLGLILYEGGLQTSWRRLREVAVPAALSEHRRGRRQHARHRCRRPRVVRPHVARGVPARGGRRVDRCGRRLLDAPRHAYPPPARAHARGRVRRERPDGDRAHARPDRLDRAPARATGSATSPLLVVRQIGIGLVVGIVLGAAAMWSFARIPESIGAFAPVASVAAAALSFGVADALGGSGFLAVYLVGLAVGSTPSRYRRQLAAFHEGLAFVAQVGLFVLLGLLVFPHELAGRRSAGSRARVPADARRAPGRCLGVDSLRVLHPPGAGAARLGRAARRGADRARDLRALLERRRQRRRSSTPSSSSSSSRRWCRERPSSAFAERLGLASSRRLAPSRRPDDRSARASSTSSSSPWRATTRSAARPFASSACRARRSSRSISRDGDVDPTARQHRRPGRRPAVRARASRTSPRSRGRLCALAAPGLDRTRFGKKH